MKSLLLVLFIFLNAVAALPAQESTPAEEPPEIPEDFVNRMIPDSLC